MVLAQAVMDRLLLGKNLLAPIRFSPTAQPDRRTLASHILTAQDAAEMVLAAIAHHHQVLPKKDRTFLMDYVDAIEQIDRERMRGRDHFAKLNRVRVDVKHLGIFPDPKQWFRVGEETWATLSVCCQQYLGLSLEELDESALIADGEVKLQYDAAVDAFHQGDFKETLLRLALACHRLFASNLALRNLHVGTARAEDALKLAAFGVHANEYLALQEFLPSVIVDAGEWVIRWGTGEVRAPCELGTAECRVLSSRLRGGGAPYPGC